MDRKIETRELIVADIGGTNARFGFATAAEATSRYQIDRFQNYQCGEHDSVEQLIARYIDSLGGPKPEQMCLSVAGPVNNDQVGITNLNWQFKVSTLRAKFGFEQLKVLNDFAALAHAVPYLNEDELLVINQGLANHEQGSTVAVLGPGTGFGLSVIVPSSHCSGSLQHGEWQVVATEGGHAGFAPTTSEEMALLQFMGCSDGRVEVEHILSGGGLEKIYQHLSVVNGTPVDTLTAAQITQAALAKDNDPLAVDSLHQFCSVLGNVAGNIALTVGARRGVYLSGGILPRMSAFLLKSNFLNRFLDQASMHAYVADIPIYLVNTPQASLLGAAMWYSKQSSI